ncbi:MAG: hypothetical protein L0I74_10235, partial [Tetragenococcus halophilus]|nr:hypothetical protein [Tetragenococcus halophilus]
EPNLPQSWSSIQFSITIRGIDFIIFVSHETISITPTQTTFVEINHENVELSANEQTTITY